MMNIDFKYKVGQSVFYKNKRYEILSRHYMQTSNNEIVKYNLRSDEDFQPNIWEDEIEVLKIIK